MTNDQLRHSAFPQDSHKIYLILDFFFISFNQLPRSESIYSTLTSPPPKEDHYFHIQLSIKLLRPSHMLRPWLRQSTRAARSLPCSQCPRPYSSRLPTLTNPSRSVRCLQTSAPASQDRVPLRKQLKQNAKALKAEKRQRRESEEASRQKWELTVGIEIHAQLNTENKLFSRARTTFLSVKHVSDFCLTRCSDIIHRPTQLKCCSVRLGFPR